MKGVNKVIIVGNLGNDPEVRQFSNGSSVTNISVATSEQWTDKQTGEKKEATEWHRISLFNKLGEIAAQYLRKGSKVYIEGSLRTRKWQDQSGQDRYTTEIRADQMQMLGEGGNTQPRSQQPNTGYNQQPAYNQQPMQSPVQQPAYSQQPMQQQPMQQQPMQQQPMQQQPMQQQPMQQQPMQQPAYNQQPMQQPQQFNNQMTAGSIPNNSHPKDDDVPF